jgi:hypothetical protein
LWSTTITTGSGVWLAHLLANFSWSEAATVEIHSVSIYNRPSSGGPTDLTASVSLSSPTALPGGRRSASLVWTDDALLLPSASSPAALGFDGCQFIISLSVSILENWPSTGEATVDLQTGTGNTPLSLLSSVNVGLISINHTRSAGNPPSYTVVSRAGTPLSIVPVAAILEPFQWTRPFASPLFGRGPRPNDEWLLQVRAKISDYFLLASPQWSILASDGLAWSPAMAPTWTAGQVVAPEGAGGVDSGSITISTEPAAAGLSPLISAEILTGQRVIIPLNASLNHPDVPAAATWYASRRRSAGTVDDAVVAWDLRVLELGSCEGIILDSYRTAPAAASHGFVMQGDTLGFQIDFRFRLVAAANLSEVSQTPLVLQQSFPVRLSFATLSMSVDAVNDAPCGTPSSPAMCDGAPMVSVVPATNVTLGIRVSLPSTDFSQLSLAVVFPPPVFELPSVSPACSPMCCSAC